MNVMDTGSFVAFIEEKDFEIFFWIISILIECFIDTIGLVTNIMSPDF